MEFAIVGAGKVGVALAQLLSRAGYPFLGAASRTLASAERACRLTGAGRAALDAAEICRDAELILITTPDGAISSVCADLAQAGGISHGAIVAHTSGVHAGAILAPARACGAAVGSMHPLQSFATTEQAVRLLPGCFCCIEGDPDAVQALRSVAEAIGARPMTIPAEGKALYHAAAVTASNYLVALQDVALALAQAAGLERQEALAALLPLIGGTVDNIGRVGIPGSLTGPIARGDTETLRIHLDAIAAHAPDALAVYKTLGLQTIRLAVGGGTLSEAQGKELRRLLT